MVKMLPNILFHRTLLKNYSSFVKKGLYTETNYVEQLYLQIHKTMFYSKLKMDGHCFSLVCFVAMNAYKERTLTYTNYVIVTYDNCARSVYLKH